jgi:4,5-dihydroxyphthalate decarboxylase
MPNELHLRYATSNDLDVFELSLDRLLTSMQPGTSSTPSWSGLPIFPTRTLGALDVLVNAASGIRGPADLRGKRVAVPLFQMSALIWLRAILRKYYTIGHEEITWVVAPPAGPDGNIRWIREDLDREYIDYRIGEDWTQLLRDGEVDAAYFPVFPDGVSNATGIRRLLNCHERRELWTQLRLDTGAVAINHLVAVQAELVAAQPHLPGALAVAFTRAKQIAHQRGVSGARAALLFADEDLERQAAIFGSDPFPIGVDANRSSIETFVDELLAEQLITSRRPLDDYLLSVEAGPDAEAEAEPSRTN